MKNLPSKLPKELTDKFQVINNTLKRDVTENPKDRITLEIGDSKQLDFLPQAKIMRWDNEVNASFRYVDNEPGEPVIETTGKIIKYVKPKVEFYAYELDSSELWGDGGLEIELLLKEKPDTNKFDFTIQTKELNFFYQPALTQQEIDEGASQPENVVGSYAVYHKTKGGMNRADGMEYKVGKAFHIYRPKVTDANGAETWGELSINEQKGELSVMIDQTWLDNAIYPVLVDPTFGYTSIGATAVSNEDLVMGSDFTISENGTANSITWYADFSGTGDLNTKAAIYEVDGDLLEASSTVNNVSSDNWYTYNLAGTLSLTSSTAYILVGWTDQEGAGNGITMRYDVTAQTRYHDSEDYTGGSFPNPASWVTSASKSISIYATYTEDGGGAVTISSARMMMGLG